MSYAVDRLSGNPRRVVPDTEGQVVEVEAAFFALRQSIHEAKWASGRRDISLHAAGKAGAVSCILVTSTPFVNIATLCGIVFSSREKVGNSHF